MRPAVAYIRVSKPKQGRGGLGLEAQQAAIRSFCVQHGYRIEGEYHALPEIALHGRTLNNTILRHINDCQRSLEQYRT